MLRACRPRAEQHRILLTMYFFHLCGMADKMRVRDDNFLRRGVGPDTPFDLQSNTAEFQFAQSSRARASSIDIINRNMTAPRTPAP